MDYSKVDAALAAKLGDIHDQNEKCLVVLIKTIQVPNAAETAFLESLGIKKISQHQQLFTATLSANNIADLSEETWVKYIKRSHELYLMDQK
ncbi:MAG: hypothetical protein ACOYVK_03550 [Bacillota bacterium]